MHHFNFKFCAYILRTWLSSLLMSQPYMGLIRYHNDEFTEYLLNDQSIILHQVLKQFRIASNKRHFFKVVLSSSKKICYICSNENPLKRMKIAFCFILKALFVLKTFKLLSSHFGHVGKTA